ncbi:tail assembly protein [Stenotrophomonas phage vB_SmaS_Bhz59]
MPAVVTTLKGVIALLPLPAEAPTRETLEWKTDVMIARSSAEQRLSVRNNPRQAFRMTVPANQGRTQLALNALYGALRQNWGIPLWTEAQHVGAVSSGLDVLPAVTDLYDFRDASLALLYQSPSQFQVIEIDTVAPGQLNLLADTNLFTNAWLMPLRVGRIAEAVDRKTNGFANSIDLSFDVDDNLGWTPDAPAQFLGEDIYYDAPIIGSDTLSDSIDQRADIADYELGPVASRTPWARPQVGRPHRTVMENAAAVRAYRDWLHRRRGKFRAFWQPTFEVDLRTLSTGTVTNTLIINNDDYQTWSRRRHIAVETLTGTWLPRTITASSFLDATRVQLTLDSAINVAASNIARVSYLGLKRLNTDRVELNWRGGGVCESSVQLLELTP